MLPTENNISERNCQLLKMNTPQYQVTLRKHYHKTQDKSRKPKKNYEQCEDHPSHIKEHRMENTYNRNKQNK